MSVRIVGFNLSHDSSACLVEDGRIAAALALERTTRVKRGTVPLHAYAASMAHLTRELLASVGSTPSAVDYWIASSTESRDAVEEGRLASLLGLVAPPERCLVLPHPGHHLAHASAAFYASGFEDASAIVVDAYGSRVGPCRERETAFVFRLGAAPECVLRILRPEDRIAGHVRDGEVWLPPDLSGIGEIYRVVTLALGFREVGVKYDDAGKTMGLAGHGRRLSEENLFIDIREGALCFDRAIDSLVDLGFAARTATGVRLLPRPPGAPIERRHMDLAAQIQCEFEEACLHLTRDVLARTGSRSLVLSGGAFLNSVVNTRIARETGIERLFVFPAATDDGNAAGAALYAYHVLVPRERPARPCPLRHVYLGPSRLGGNGLGASGLGASGTGGNGLGGGNGIGGGNGLAGIGLVGNGLAANGLAGNGLAGNGLETLASRWRLPVQQHGDVASMARSAAKAIARGEIVGWFQDRAEFGPRALGARSILCHPGIAGMKDRLNARVKFREAFRPFAASVLAERAAEWFDLPMADSPFMLLVCAVRPQYRNAVAEIVHVDGSCRIQTVDRDLPGPFRSLIEAFEAETGVPMLLNTSFNLRGMPIVERPDDAVDCLYGSRLDRVFLGELEIAGPELTALRPLSTRRDVRLADSLGERPAFTGGAEARVGVDAHAGADVGAHAGALNGTCVGPGGCSGGCTDACKGNGARAGILDRADGVLSIRAIADAIGMETEAAVDLALDLRRHGLLRWAELPVPGAFPFPLKQYDPDTSID